MKTYTLKKLLIFFEHQVKTDFEAIKKIVSRIDLTAEDELSISETRDFIHQTLRNAGMLEEEFEGVHLNESSEEKEIIMEPGSRETMAVFEQFEIKISDKLFHLLINLN